MTTGDVLKEVSKIARKKGMTQQEFLTAIYKFYLIHEMDLKIKEDYFTFNDNVAVVKEV